MNRNNFLGGNKKRLSIPMIVSLILYQGKKGGMSPYICYGEKAGYIYNPPTELGLFGGIQLIDSLGDVIHQQQDYCLNSNNVRQYWCNLICYNQQCWATDSDTFFSVDFNCDGGCSNGICIVTHDYTSFLFHKSSYLSGGSFSTFISSANSWVSS